MIDAMKVQALRRALFRDQTVTAFTVLDGASVPGLAGNLASFNPPHVCLFRGEPAPDLAQVAPYLVLLERDASFTEWVLGGGWGRHWGIFGVSGAGLPVLRNHFRKFLTVYDEKGKSLYFRYYDPRVLRVYLPLCSSEELEAMFGPVTSYLVEDEVEDATRFYCQENVLRLEKVPLKRVEL